MVAREKENSRKGAKPQRMTEHGIGEIIVDDLGENTCMVGLTTN